MGFSRFVTKRQGFFSLKRRQSFRELKQSLGQDITIDTGRGCIAGTLLMVKKGNIEDGKQRLVLQLRDVRVEGDNAVEGDTPSAGAPKPKEPSKQAPVTINS